MAVWLNAISRDHRYMERIMCACCLTESAYFVSKLQLIVFVNGIFALREFHFANIDDMIAAGNEHIYLCSADRENNDIRKQFRLKLDFCGNFRRSRLYYFV